MNRSVKIILAAATVLSLAGSAATPAFAQSVAAKAAVDAGKAQGEVGEQGDGYLGIVRGGDAALTAAVAEINAGRAAVYRDTAAKTGVTAAAAGQAAAQQLFARLQPGQYYKPLEGSWTKK